MPAPILPVRYVRAEDDQRRPAVRIGDRHGPLLTEDDVRRLVGFALGMGMRI